MQDKIKELEQEIARMQKSIEELKKEAQAASFDEESCGVYIGQFQGFRTDNRLMFKDGTSILTYYCSDNTVADTKLSFAKEEYSPKALTANQLKALDALIGKFADGMIP